MAKMKQWAVDAEITIRTTLYVNARREGGARERLLTDEGWREALTYAEDVDLRFHRQDAVLKRARVAGA